MTLPRILIALGALAFAHSAAAERLILRDADYEVYRMSEACDRLVELGIATSRPSIFADGSESLNSLVSAARAIVAFECPENQALRLLGYDAQTKEQLFTGRAASRNNWSVVTRYRAPRVASSVEADNTTAYQVAELSIGMSMSSVRRKLEQDYGNGGVRFEDSNPPRVLAGNPECPFVSGRQLDGEFPVGARCLRITFTRGSNPTLDRLLMVQAVPGDQITAGIGALQDRYGRPEYQKRRDPDYRERQAGYGGVLELGWGGEVERKRSSRRSGSTHQLNSELATTGRSTLLVLRLTAPSEEPVKEEPQGGFGF